MNQILVDLLSVMAAVAASPLFHVPGFLACMLQ
jgi:hypothetical protein